ncbi:hypothetical protein HII31_01802 [Pseudocercospora fuligena]|uniref:XPG N-terminal domain-containing protein n=1 Tax=Pseudocercospora fuligena TaxID=685502 RepID=A0A8H6RSW6_9PEZI|nr:hypothetical protein HII31_01802 [Pseudocercospora fuligena]
MGVTGFWDVVEPLSKAKKTSLTQESGDHFREYGRPLRIAVDASILLFKHTCKTESVFKNKPFGGINHAAKAFIDHIKDIMLEGVDPVLVFDGPDRPAVKRGRPTVRTTSDIREVPPNPSFQDVLDRFDLGHTTALVKLFLQRMGLQCKLLQQRLKLKRNLQKIEAQKLEKTGRTQFDWIIAAWLSGGDYSDGIRDCGPTTALAIAKEIKAARPQLVHMLAGIARSNRDVAALNGMLLGLWNTLVGAILEICKSSVIQKAMKADFPNHQVLGLYVRAKASSISLLEGMKTSLWQRRPVSFPELRQTAANHFTWHNQDRARQFLWNFTPAFLARELLLASQSSLDRLDLIVSAKPQKPKADEPSMVRVRYKALDVIPIDYDGECQEPSGRKPYDEKNTKTPYKLYTVDLPKFLLELGAPRCLHYMRGGPVSKKRQAGSDPERGQPKKPKPTGTRVALSSIPEVGNRLVPMSSGSKVTQKRAPVPEIARSQYSMVNNRMTETIDLTDE